MKWFGRLFQSEATTPKIAIARQFEADTAHPVSTYVFHPGAWSPGGSCRQGLTHSEAQAFTAALRARDAVNEKAERDRLDKACYEAISAPPAPAIDSGGGGDFAGGGGGSDFSGPDTSQP